MPEDEEPYKNPNQRGLEAMMNFFGLIIAAAIIVPLLLIGAIGWAVWVWWK